MRTSIIASKALDFNDILKILLQTIKKVKRLCSSDYSRKMVEKYDR